MNQNLPELNVPLLEAAMGRIIAEPETWDQSAFACGTTRCIAGHVAELLGATFVYRKTPLASRVVAFDCTTAAGDVVPVDSYAADALGLTKEEARRLFEIGRPGGRFTTDVDELHRRVKDLIESRQGGVA